MRRLKQILSALLSFALGIVVTFSALTFIDNYSEGVGGWTLPWWGIVLSLLPLVFLAVLLHEAGHMIAGVMAGMRPVAFVVGPISVEFREGRFSGLHLQKFFPGGFAYCMADRSRPISAQLIALVSGGPLASLLWAIFGFGVAFYLGGASGDLFLIFGIFSALAFLITIIPAATGGLITDGGRLIGLVFNTENGRNFREYFERTVALFDTPSPRHWPHDLPALEAAVEKAPAQSLDRLAARLIHFWSLLDHGDYTLARTLLAPLKDSMPDALPAVVAGSYHMEFAIFELLLNRDIQTAEEEWRNVVAGPLTDRYTEKVYTAVLASVHDDTDGMAAAMAQARALFSEARLKSIAALYETLFQALEAGKLPLTSAAPSPGQTSSGRP